MTAAARVAVGHARLRHPGLTWTDLADHRGFVLSRSACGRLLVAVVPDGRAFDRDDRPLAVARLRCFRPDGTERQ